jgi:hypothetical protein
MAGRKNLLFIVDGNTYGFMNYAFIFHTNNHV